MRNSRPLVVLRDGENPWVTYQKREVFRKNKCINGIAVGEPGSGKSWGVLSNLCLINPDLELEGNVFFKAGDMMREIRRYYDNKPKKGKIWFYDEAGIDANNLNFRDQINRGLNAFFQTARHRNYIFWMTVPFFSFVSKGVRTLMNCQMKAEGVLESESLTRIVPNVLQYNDEIDKIFKKRIAVSNRNGATLCNEILLPKPPKKLRIEYEKRKKEFTSSLFGDIADNIDREQSDKDRKRYGRALTPKQDEVFKLLKSGKLVKEIAEITDRKVRGIYVCMEAIKKKGIHISHIRRGTDKVIGYKVVDMRE